MQTLQGISCLLLLQTLGELLARALGLALPGPVLGMLLLLLALRWPFVARSVGAVAEFLLSHLSLLFVPVGVGVLTHLDLLDRYGGRIVVVIVVSTALSLATTALLLNRLMRGRLDEAAPAPQDAP